MNLTQLYTRINTIVDAVAPSIQRVHVGFISELKGGKNTYDILLIVPPRLPQWDFRQTKGADSYEIRWMLIRQDKNSKGSVCTPAERMAIWVDLLLINQRIIQAMGMNNDLFKFTTGVTYDLNSGGQDEILSDKVLWIETTFSMDTTACPDGVELILPLTGDNTIVTGDNTEITADQEIF